jgi:acyl-CoA-binding protein
MNIEKEFQDSIRFINNLGSETKIYKIKLEERLKIYGLYKQSLFGDNIAPKPYFFYFKSLNKWTAWKQQFGKSKSDAKQEYINNIHYIRSKVIFNI